MGGLSWGWQAHGHQVTAAWSGEQSVRSPQACDEDPGNEVSKTPAHPRVTGLWRVGNGVEGPEWWGSWSQGKNAGLVHLLLSLVLRLAVVVWKHRRAFFGKLRLWLCIWRPSPCSNGGSWWKRHTCYQSVYWLFITENGSIPRPQGRQEIKCILQGVISGKGSLFAKPSGPLEISLVWRTLFWGKWTWATFSI